MPRGAARRRLPAGTTQPQPREPRLERRRPAAGALQQARDAGGHRVDLDAGFRLSSYVTRPAREDLGIVEGARLVATFKGQAVHLVPR